QWRPLHPARLLWVEALDGGDPLAKIPHRDRVLRLDMDKPDSEPEEWFRLEHRFSGWDWPDDPTAALVTQYDRDRRWRTTFLRPDLAHTPSKVVFDLSVNDAYNDPGAFVTQLRPDGQRTLRQDGDQVWMAGRGATPEGDRPFLDAFDLGSGERTRVFTCGETHFESFVGFTPDQSLLIARQSRTEPMNLFVRGADVAERRLTEFRDPHPEITGMHKELVRYQRADGVPLSGTLYLPAGWTPESGARLPLLFWAYPEEYSDAATAGQVRGSDRTFTRLAGTSPLWFVAHGWAVLDDASVPVIGDPETMNDTFAEQITAAAKAAIETLDQRGIVDPNRVVAAGHSYGAFMTANLLAAAPGLFAAGIARSGAYNRTLTPFGFQSERRSYWEAPDVYHRLSPFTHADKIKDPLLLIHGAEDNNPGTHTLQSERFHQALVAHGATVRLVLLPHESHGYRARESVLHVLHEMLVWADRFAGPDSVRARSGSGDNQGGDVPKTGVDSPEDEAGA
ncbi:MAG: alpha/beta hydrolase family protein, partial [Armatimonadaceae bacterium]